MTYHWPRVLLGIDLDVWERKDGGGDAVIPNYKWKEGYNSPQVATVRQWWQKTVPAAVVPQPMIPEGFTFNTPYFDIGVPPCLHATIPLTATIGTVDPHWKPGSVSRTFEATNPPDWPETITWNNIRPAFGGYVVTEYQINKPS